MNDQVGTEGGSKRILGLGSNVVAYLLLLLTAILGLVDILLARQISIVIFTQINPSPSVWALNFLNAIVVLILAMVWIVYVFGTFEILSRKSRRRKFSWNILVWAVALELFILILYFVII